MIDRFGLLKGSIGIVQIIVLVLVISSLVKPKPNTTNLNGDYSKLVGRGSSYCEKAHACTTFRVTRLASQIPEVKHKYYLTNMIHLFDGFTHCQTSNEHFAQLLDQAYTFLDYFFASSEGEFFIDAQAASEGAAVELRRRTGYDDHIFLHSNLYEPLIGLIHAETGDHPAIETIGFVVNTATYIGFLDYSNVMFTLSYLHKYLSLHYPTLLQVAAKVIKEISVDLFRGDAFDSPLYLRHNFFHPLEGNEKALDALKALQTIHKALSVPPLSLEISNQRRMSQLFNLAGSIRLLWTFPEILPTVIAFFEIFCRNSGDLAEISKFCHMHPNRWLEPEMDESIDAEAD